MVHSCKSSTAKFLLNKRFPGTIKQITEETRTYILKCERVQVVVRLELAVLEDGPGAVLPLQQLGRVTTNNSTKKTAEKIIHYIKEGSDIK